MKVLKTIFKLTKWKSFKMLLWKNNSIDQKDFAQKNINSRATDLLNKENLIERKKFIRDSGYYIAVPIWISCWSLEFLCYPDRIVLFGIIRLVFVILTLLIVEIAKSKLITSEFSTRMISYIYLGITSVGLSTLLLLTGGAGSLYLPFLNLLSVTCISGFGKNLKEIVIVVILSFTPFCIGLCFLGVSNSEVNILIVNGILASTLIVVSGRVRYFFTQSQLKECEMRISLGDEVDSRNEEIQKRTAGLLSLEVEASLGRQAAQIAHDIRSPLSALNAVVSEFRKLSFDERELLSIIIDRINGISEELLKNYRGRNNYIVENSVGFEIKKTSVLIALDTLISEKKYEFSSKNQVKIIFESNLNQGDCVLIPPNIFKRAISNLINNGIEASENNGTIIVNAKKMKFYVEIKISDFGSGIPIEIISDIRNGGLTYGKSEGTGLGLSFAYDTLRKFGGSLEIESRAGNGTDVVIRVPLVGV